jgi:hypothetical protein
MICENCGNLHDGLYGTGRFCNEKCARAFSTKIKRKEINAKVSQTLKDGFESGRLHNYGVSGNSHHTFTRDEMAKGGLTKKKKVFERWLNEGVGCITTSVYQYIVDRQNGKCAKCPTKQFWNGLPLSFQVHHKDGNKHNNHKENVELLCPNCHTQTESWGYKKAYRKA